MPKTVSPHPVLALALAVLLLSSPTIAHADTAPTPVGTTPAAAIPVNASGESSWSWMATALSPFETLSHWVGGLFSREEKAVMDEVDQFKHTIDTDLTAFDALVRQAGFRVASISVGANLVPKMALALAFERRLSEPEKAALMAKITDTTGVVGTIQRSIIMTLLNAAESVYAVRTDGYRLAEVDIDIGIIPNATFVLTKGR